MDTYSAKKLGEVLAFAEVGLDTFKKGRKGLLEVFSDEDLSNIERTLEEHRESIIKVASGKEVLETTTSKAEATSEKLLSMQDRYLEDEDDWEDPAELLEWLGFFEGAAVVHWSLVSGSADTHGIQNLSTLAHEANQFHRDILDIIAAYAANIGEETAGE